MEEEGDLVPLERIVRRRASELAVDLASRAAPAHELFVEEAGSFRCVACAHRCVLDGDRAGACGVRFRRGGQGFAPWGYVARRYVRAVETNTVYHVAPGAKALTFGMYGCDLRCPYCHNFRVSQALREDEAGEAPSAITAAALVDEAVAAECRVMCAAYNEPMIAAEWTRAVLGAARARGLKTVVVSDGHTTPEALAYMRPAADVFRIDLKGSRPEHYKALGGRIEPVLAAIAEARRLGFWVEVVTLVVPGFNDDDAGLRSIAKTIAAIDPEIPWHLNAFQPRYKMADRPPMFPELLLSIAGAAYARGLRYVYVGNVSGAFSELEHTRCPGCHTVVVERKNYTTVRSTITPSGTCPSCATALPGLWH